MKAIAPGEVHVWRVLLDEREANENHLSEDERDRADRFARPHLRRDFVVARGRLRTILGGYLDTPPERVRFSVGPHGKPEIDPCGSVSPIRFNLTHSGRLALVSVTRDAAVGIDVEATDRKVSDMDAVAARFFAPGEVAAWRAVASSDRIETFFRIWTRKEAFLKATGEGISRGLGTFEVTADSSPARLVRVDGDDPLRWTLLDLDAGPGYCASLAMEVSEPPSFRYL